MALQTTSHKSTDAFTAEPEKQTHHLSAGDAVWIATALLHRELPEQSESGFEKKTIAQRVLQERLTDVKPDTVEQHISQHCVANSKRDPSHLRFLVRVSRGHFRLYKNGDPYDPTRAGGPIMPEHLPKKYADLMTWYRHWDGNRTNLSNQFQPLLDLIGSGKKIWADEHADEYVRHLREGWE